MRAPSTVSVSVALISEYVARLAQVAVLGPGEVPAQADHQRRHAEQAGEHDPPADRERRDEGEHRRDHRDRPLGQRPAAPTSRAGRRRGWSGSAGRRSRPTRRPRPAGRGRCRRSPRGARRAPARRAPGERSRAYRVSTVWSDQEAGEQQHDPVDVRDGRARPRPPRPGRRAAAARPARPAAARACSASAPPQQPRVAAGQAGTAYRRTSRASSATGRSIVAHRVVLGLGLAGDDAAVGRVAVEQLGVGAGGGRPGRRARNATTSTASSISGLRGGHDRGAAGAVRRAAGRRSGPRCGRRRRRSARPAPGPRGRQRARGPAPAAAAGRRRSCGRARSRSASRPSGRASSTSSRAAVASARLGLAAAAHVEPVAEPAGEQVRAGVGDHDPAAYLRAGEVGQRHAAERHVVVRPRAAHRPSRSASRRGRRPGCSETIAVSRPGSTRSPVRASTSSAPGGGDGARLGRVGELRVEREHPCRSAGRPRRARIDLVGVLGRGAQRDHEERGVAVERDQLAGGDRAADGRARAEPDHDHHEDAGQEAPGARRAPTAAGRPRRRRRGPSGTRGGSGRGRPARRRSRAARAGRRRCRWRCWRADPSGARWWLARVCSGAGAGRSAASARGTPISTTSPSVTEVWSRITETRTNDTTAPAKRAETSMTWPMADEVGGADRDHLAGRDLAGQRAAEADGLAGDQLDGAVRRGQPVGHREPVPHDAADRLHQPDQRAARRRTSAAPRCPGRRRPRRWPGRSPRA